MMILPAFLLAGASWCIPLSPMAETSPRRRRGYAHRRDLARLRRLRLRSAVTLLRCTKAHEFDLALWPYRVQTRIEPSTTTEHSKRSLRSASAWCSCCDVAAPLSIEHEWFFSELRKNTDWPRSKETEYNGFCKPMQQENEKWLVFAE